MSNKNLHVLVVEDDVPSHASLIKLIALLGYRVLGVTTLREATRALHENPDCCLLDLMLPDGNGAELLADIRGQSMPIQVAIASASSNPDTLQRVQSLAPDKFFRKPLDVPALIAWLQSLHHRKCAAVA